MCDAVSSGEVTDVSKDLSAFILRVRQSITAPALHGISDYTAVQWRQRPSSNLYAQKQDRQCTSEVTFRRVRATIVAMEKQYVEGVHKGMVQFQKLTRNLFLTLHGQNIHRQQRQLS